MICQIGRLFNRLPRNFWEISLKELYENVLRVVRTRRTRFYLPSTERICGADGYILWGTYTRARIIDIQRKPCEGGGWKYEEVIIEEFPVQRIRDKDEGATHAVLSEFFVPYKQYSLRFILFHLQQFFSQLTTTQENYCLDAGIETKTFERWLQWLRNHISLLYGFGLTKSYSDNRDKMKRWAEEMVGDIPGWTYSSLQKLNRALFQARKMPGKTKYRNYERPG